MQTSEFLRKLADLLAEIAEIENNNDTEQPDVHVVAAPVDVETPAPAEVPDIDQSADGDASPLTISPTAHKLELLKKAIGVESEFSKDDLNKIREMVGQNPTVLNFLSDEILDE